MLVDIEAALAARTQQIGLPIAWVGRIYQPAQGQRYVSHRNVASRSPPSIGPFAPYLWTGTLTLVANCPGDEGITPAISLAMELCDLFSRGTTLISNAASVLIISSSPGTPYGSNDWLHVPVNIPWNCDQP